METMEDWRRVVSAIEAGADVYDRVNSAISLGQDGPSRRFVVRSARVRGGGRVLDAGCGPGNTTRLLVEETDAETIVALDASRALLRRVKEELGDDPRVHVVCGAFESLPFKAEGFHAVTSTFALRDAISLVGAVEEFGRVVVEGGRLCVADIARAQTRVGEMLAGVYLREVVPRLARVAMGVVRGGNPWREIHGTYLRLPSFDRQVEIFEEVGSVRVFRFLFFGGITVFVVSKDGESRGG